MENDPKICRNCSTEVQGQFCHQCGQRYHEHKETFGDLAFEFVSDFLHFDSKFLRTAFPLLFAPGRLTRLYNSGKHQSQYHPIKLYIFCSFLYFLLFFAMNDPVKNARHGNMADESSTIQKDTAEKETLGSRREFATFKNERTNLVITVPAGIDSLLKQKKSPETYKKEQAELDRSKRDGLFVRMMTIRLLEVNLNGEAGRKEFFIEVIESFLHNIPKMLFILLPVFALFLKLLYIRRKQFYYVDHAILSLHYFSFIFLLLTICSYGLDRLFDTLIFTGLAVIWIITYLFIAMKRLYKQGWFKTVFKFLVLGSLFLVTMVFLTFVNLAWSTLY